MNIEILITFGALFITALGVVLAGVWAIENRFEKKLETVKREIKSDIKDLSVKVENNGMAIARLEAHKEAVSHN